MRFFRYIKLIAFLALLLAASSMVQAQNEDLKRAVAAYNSGDYAKAVSLWEPHARQGNREAQYSMGVAFYEGKGASRDLDQAIAWFRKAADSGHPTAMFNLGVAYWEGRGVKQNFSQAVDWWERAAELGDITSQYNLGLAYYLGKGAERDISKARDWLSRSAEQQHADARRVLGIIDKNNPAVKNDQPATPAKPKASVDTRSETAQQESLSPAKTTAPTASNKIVNTNFTAAHVQSSHLTVRAQPNLSAPATRKLRQGSPIKIIQHNGSWARLELPSPTKVWVFGKYVAGQPGGRITANRVRVRTHPTTGADSSVVLHLEKGTTVTVHAQSGDWKQISVGYLLQNWVQQSGLVVQKPVTQDWLDAFNALANPGQTGRSTAVSTPTEVVVAPFKTAWVTTDNAPVVGRPDAGAPIVSLLDKGITVKVIGSKNGWMMIKSPMGLDVWVYGKFVKESGGQAHINDDRVRIRSLPSTGPDSDVLGLLDKGTAVEVISRKGDWSRLRVLNSVAGWIKQDQLTTPGAITPDWQARWDAIRLEATR
ncbi:MAG: SH3 domain-containing protein [Arenicellales bacterium]|jgi:hypothetical protein|nr:SH3 domain-containing protein [Arenicellales bacterium]